jgi:UDP-glucose 4-epimerase
MKVLVVGGAGYIGSHMVKALTNAGHDVVTLDNLCTGHRDSVRYGRLFEADLQDCAALDGLLATEWFDGVMHFASFIEVGESVTDPAKYYRNNVANTQNLLDSIVRHGLKRFIFSSTAAIFGKPEYIPIDEEHPKRPLNPYGRTKLMVEEMLADYDRAYGLKSVSLRYFNAAGADPHGELGERHEPETHLIPLVLQAACSSRVAITLFGTDYDTPDGTCIRDYIHVSDLCDAHLLALESLLAGQGSAAYNLGNGNGYSVREVIEAAREVTQQPIRIIEGARRPGDPDRLVANSRLARERLGWKPRFTDLEQIIAHAWAWKVRSTATAGTGA